MEYPEQMRAPTVIALKGSLMTKPLRTPVTQSFNSEYTLSESEKQEIRKPGRKYYMSYFPPGINSIYAGLKLNVDRLLGYKSVKKEFLQKNGYELNLTAPGSYNEKLVRKKLFDRNPLLTITADKYKVRSYVREKLGEEESEKILIPLYHATDDPATIPFEDLPERFVVKPNHGSKMHWIITGDKDLLRDRIVKTCRRWLRNNFGMYDNQWAYINIERKIIVEKLMLTDNGFLPMDYKAFCFHGKCRVFRVSLNRFGQEDLTAYYDTDWNLLPVKNYGYKMMKKPIPRPPDLEKIIELSEKLSADFDAVRVDFYCFERKIYFGELTHYHASGLSRFEPVSYDFELGSYWKADANGYSLKGYLPGR